MKHCHVGLGRVLCFRYLQAACEYASRVRKGVLIPHCHWLSLGLRCMPQVNNPLQVLINHPSSLSSTVITVRHALLQSCPSLRDCFGAADMCKRISRGINRRSKSRVSNAAFSHHCYPFDKVGRDLNPAKIPAARRLATLHVVAVLGHIL